MVMTHPVESASDQHDAPSRLALWSLFAGLAMMAVAAIFMWWTFGPSMFVSLVNAAMNCF